MHLHYILDENNNPIPEDDDIKWAKFFEDRTKRTIARTIMGKYAISTVFLGIDHGYLPESPPILFETMVFVSGDDSGIFQERCSTYEDAVSQHISAVICSYNNSFDIENDVPEPEDIADYKLIGTIG